MGPDHEQNAAITVRTPTPSTHPQCLPKPPNTAPVSCPRACMYP